MRHLAPDGVSTMLWPMGTKIRLAAVIGLTAIVAACSSSPIASPSPSGGGTPSSAALVVNQDEMPDGEVGLAYSGFSFVAKGGNAPYAWSVASGTLPAGMTLTTQGDVFGTPASAGIYNFDVRVSDAHGRTATDTCSMKIVAALAVKPLKSGNVIVESGSTGGPFAQLSGGAAPFTYKIASGSLPAGTSLQALGLEGNFTGSGVYTFTVTAGDALGAAVSLQTTYVVFAPIRFAAPPAGSTFNATCQGTVPTGCSASVSYSGGYPGTTPKLTWYPANASTGQPQSCVEPYTYQCVLSVRLQGARVQVTYAPQTPRVPGPIGWSGQAVITLTDPVTGETTTAHVRVLVTFSY